MLDEYSIFYYNIDKFLIITIGNIMTALNSIPLDRATTPSQFSQSEDEGLFFQTFSNGNYSKCQFTNYLSIAEVSFQKDDEMLPVAQEILIPEKKVMLFDEKENVISILAKGLTFSAGIVLGCFVNPLFFIIPLSMLLASAVMNYI
jgi:hypothetical protein